VNAVGVDLPQCSIDANPVTRRPSPTG
jgi:hypothetical protein